MPPGDKPSSDLLVLREARERAIARLSDAFAHDVITVEEFERRLTLAHRAETLADMGATVSDLNGEVAVPAEILPAQNPMTSLASSLAMGRVAALWGGVERRGPWTPPRQLQVIAFMGGIVLDFREAFLSPGVTEVQVVALMGGVQIIVPPGLAVHVSGAAIMGGFGHVERTPVRPDPTQPLLRVSGLALMGGVSIETRLPGESDADAYRRQMREARQPMGSFREPKRLVDRGRR
jgi:hypothetical protein